MSKKNPPRPTQIASSISNENSLLKEEKKEEREKRRNHGAPLKWNTIPARK